MTTITPFLWFDDNAEQAIERYLRVFDDAELVEENRLHDGKLFIATIRLQGTTLTLMNGGPDHKLTDAFSLSVSVETQDEVDKISDALIDGGGEQGPCGWLVDAFGLSWQIVPTLLMRLLSDPDREKAGRAQAAMMQMKRLDLQALQDAFDGR
ncbi:VOC family protein [Aeromicrobium ginsengisoli]|uniref:VOC family protein n=1 Tax=Aeromicrobium ginsengisoli TaxID=363867 RepID=A0A5M4FBE7_9ACTN|nr:VOC family protein [Aeromicrobium ginsengisoli]KAA1395625.1 VOC family protein [Aeromicrobium ginsengisoli]